MLFALALASGLLDCPAFAPGPYYTRPIASAPVDADSSQYIRSMIDAGSTGGFWIAAEPAETVNVAGPKTPVYRVHPKVPYHAFGEPYPWDADFHIEPLSDAHAIVVRAPSCDLYETYDTTFTNGVFSAYSGAHWNLRRAFLPLEPGTPSAMASGLSLYAGMVRWEEVASGEIRHALNWAAPAGTVAQWSFVRPASDAEGIRFKGTGKYRLPYGARLRLRASFDISRFGPQSATIARAMKRYGIYLADTARENELYNAMPFIGSNRWNRADLEALASIHIGDFEVLSLGTVENVPGHN
ncbi:MAG TPA: hypothetical protein VFE35_06940 [Candidatus Cybelea sp.]|jgi:hypothetical protein|nr:hypothetical protein [Candidatus Cybelea sp.]